MKFKKSLTILTLLIFLLALVAASVGLFSNWQSDKKQFTSLQGQTIELYGKGLYQNESVAVAAQGKAQDAVTLFLALPVLLVALVMFRKGLFKGKLLLAGTLGYFLYSYISYAFLCMYNNLFLVYVSLMSLSLYAFVLAMMTFDVSKIKDQFSERLPVKFIGGVLIFIGCMLAMLWLKLLLTPMMEGTAPKELEHYTTLVIQAMDLGLVIPTSIVSAILLIKRKPFGYLLASVLMVKAATMLICIIAMIVGQQMAGVVMDTSQVVVFSVMAGLVLFCFYLLLRNTKEVID